MTSIDFQSRTNRGRRGNMATFPPYALNVDLRQEAEAVKYHPEQGQRKGEVNPEHPAHPGHFMAQ